MNIGGLNIDGASRDLSEIASLTGDGGCSCYTAAVPRVASR